MEVPEEFRHRESEKLFRRIPRGDIGYVAILAESILLSALFIGVPLILRARAGLSSIKGFPGFVAYFGALGFSFIVIEICLMKRYVLFLGHPATSITVTIVSLLFGAGIGSLVTQRIGVTAPRRTLGIVVSAIAAALFLESYFVPMLLNNLLYLSFAPRVFVAGLILIPLGMLLGMPFPLGLRLIDQRGFSEESRQQLVAWA